MTRRDVALISGALLFGGTVSVIAGAYLCKWAILKVLP